MSDPVTLQIAQLGARTGEPDAIAQLRLAMRQTARALRDIAADLDAAVLTDPTSLLVEAPVGFGRIDAAREILTDYAYAAAEAAGAAGIPVPQASTSTEIN